MGNFQYVFFFGFCIHAAGGLVEDQDRSVAKDRPGDGNKLPLPLAEVVRAAGDNGLVPLRQPGNKPVGPRLPGGLPDLGVGG
ncbi:hypothetical protein SDC9_201612 [bioreactor metagenome]|uniref:Uncharacterized protein n=1 Tax=bioreactor metagenome TaxID=1076179 RepID=A0A645J3A2_9ZZZZ